jgi:hypothetical protein
VRARNTVPEKIERLVVCKRSIVGGNSLYQMYTNKRAQEHARSGCGDRTKNRSLRISTVTKKRGFWVLHTLELAHVIYAKCGRCLSTIIFRRRVVC